MKFVAWIKKQFRLNVIIFWPEFKNSYIFWVFIAAVSSIGMLLPNMFGLNSSQAHARGSEGITGLEQAKLIVVNFPQQPTPECFKNCLHVMLLVS